MSVEIVFPIEFIVAGTPVSFQAKRPETRIAWRNRVRRESDAALPEGHFATDAPIAVTLFYFPEQEMAGDIDNIVKPVLDALCRHVYRDDRQVARVWVQKFEPAAVVRFGAPSNVLAEAVGRVRPFLYIRLSDDPMEGLA